MMNINPFKYTLSFVLLMFASLCQAGIEDRKYHLIVDANSTKTTLYLYQYDYHEALPYNLKIVLKNIIEPGIARIKSDAIDAYLKRIFHDELSATLDSLAGDGMKGRGASILNQVQFYTTGGMRALPKSEQLEKNVLIETWVNKWLISHAVNVKKTDIDIRTLPGEEEAAYAWVAVNYLESLFNGKLSGVATINGASTQVAYLDDHAANIMVQVANKKYAITGKSFPLGQNVITEKLSREDGCYLKGYKFSATGNYVRCRVAAKAIINKQVRNSVDYAPMVNDYRLYANFYYSANFLDIEMDYSLTALQKAAEAYCSTSWEDAKEDHPDINRNYLAYYCMGAAFQGALLEDTYYLKGDDHTLTTQNSIDDFKLTWPIGALVSQSYQLLD